MSKIYPSDLSDSQWEQLNSYLESIYCGRGRRLSPRTRSLWNGLMYVLRSGCSWRMLPDNFPCWQAVYSYFRRLKNKGHLEVIMHKIIGDVRCLSDREKSPSIGIVDSQSVKSRSGKKNRQRL